MARQLRDRATIQKPKRLIDEVDESPRKKRGKQGTKTVAVAPQPAVESSSLPTSRSPEDDRAQASSHGVQAGAPAPDAPAPDAPAPDAPAPDAPAPGAPAPDAPASDDQHRAKPAGTWQQLPAELRLKIYEYVGYPPRLKEIPGSHGPKENQPAYFRVHDVHVLRNVSRSLREEVRHEQHELHLKGGMDIIIHEWESTYQGECLIRLILRAVEGEARCIAAGQAVGSRTWHDLAITRPIIQYLERGNREYPWKTMDGAAGRSIHQFIVLSDKERTVLEKWLELQLEIERNRKPDAQCINFRFLHPTDEDAYENDFDNWPDYKWHVMTEWMHDWCDLDTAEKIRMVAVIGPTADNDELARFQYHFARYYRTRYGKEVPDQMAFDLTRPEEVPVFDLGEAIIASKV